MVTLPGDFNFPTAQQQMPGANSVFNLVQAMSGMGGNNMLGGGLSNSIGQLMHPGGAPLIGGGVPTGGTVLPPMPKIPTAPPVQPRGPKPPVVDPAAPTAGMPDWKNMTGQQMWNMTEGPAAMTNGIPPRPKDFKPSAEQISGMHRAAQAASRNNPGRR